MRSYLLWVRLADLLSLFESDVTPEGRTVSATRLAG